MDASTLVHFRNLQGRPKVFLSISDNRFRVGGPLCQGPIISLIAEAATLIVDAGLPNIAIVVSIMIWLQ